MCCFLDWMYASNGWYREPKNISKYHNFCKLRDYLCWAVFLRLTYFHTFEIFTWPTIIDLTFLCIFFKVLTSLKEDPTQSLFWALLIEWTALYDTNEDHFAASKYLFNLSIFKFQFSFISLLSFSFPQLQSYFSQLFIYSKKYHFILFHITFTIFAIELISR